MTAAELAAALVARGVTATVLGSEVHITAGDRRVAVFLYDGRLHAVEWRWLEIDTDAGTAWDVDGLIELLEEWGVTE